MYCVHIFITPVSDKTETFPNLAQSPMCLEAKLECHTSQNFDVHRAVHRNIISIVKLTRCTNVSNLFYFKMTLYMFRTVLPYIIRSWRLYIQQQIFVKQILLSACCYCCLLASSKQTALSVWHMPFAVCKVLHSWGWTERPSETCRVLFQNKINLIQWCI
jgi:hypothetical protein